MERLSTTEITALLNVTDSRIRVLVSQAEIEDSEISRKGLKKIFSPKALRKLLSRRGFSYSEINKIIALTNNKGGVGKTSSTVNIAQMASNLGLRVLVIDNDPQANCTSYLLEIGTTEAHHCLYDVVQGRASLGEAIVNISEGLDLLPSNLSNNRLDSYFHGKNLNAATFYKKLLASVEYDLIIWDLSPSLSTSNTFALMSCDEILVVTDLSEFGYQGVEMTIDNLNCVAEEFPEFRPKVEILVNKFDERKLKSLEYISKLQELAPMNSKIIKIDSAVEQAQMNNIPLSTKSKAYKEYMELVSQIIGLSTLKAPVQAQ